MRHRPLLPAALGAVLSLAFVGAAVVAAAPPIGGDGATATAHAERVAAPAPQEGLSGDTVAVYENGDLSAAVRDAAFAAAADSGSAVAVIRGFTAALSRVTRGATVVQQSTGDGWAFPMSAAAMPVDAARAVFGAGVADALATGGVVMNRSSADLRGAKPGDVLEVLTASFAKVSVPIAAVVDGASVGGSELLMAPATADALGAGVETRVLLYSIGDRARVDGALHAHGLDGRTTIRIRHSWDPPDPDTQLSLLDTKLRLGEFDLDYAHLSTLGWTSINATWLATSLPSSRELFPTGIKARCHLAVRDDLAAALQEMADAGLGGLVDLADTNTSGGCSSGQARLARLKQSLGVVSRHSWGQAIDINPTANCQGCTPKWDCQVVRIFRRHNFAWGGNFLTPDGMHFEWVGERRDGQLFPSRYCPNTVPSGAQRAHAPPVGQGNAALFTGNGL